MPFTADRMLEEPLQIEAGNVTSDESLANESETESSVGTENADLDDNIDELIIQDTE